MSPARRLSPGVAAAAVGLMFLPASTHARSREADPQSALLGVWAPDSRSEVLLKGAPLTAEGARIHAEHLAERDQPDPQFDRTRWCAGPGLPRIMLMPYPFEIKAERGYLAFLFGWYRWSQVVDMSGRAPEYALPTSMGFSSGRWIGPELEIHTVGLDDQTILDASGLPHSDQLDLKERLRVLPNGHLQVRFTIEDPTYYTRRWDAVATYHRAPKIRIEDDVCPDRIARGEPAVIGHRP